MRFTRYTCNSVGRNDKVFVPPRYIDGLSVQLLYHKQGSVFATLLTGYQLALYYFVKLYGTISPVILSGAKNLRASLFVRQDADSSLRSE